MINRCFSPGGPLRLTAFRLPVVFFALACSLPLYAAEPVPHVIHISVDALGAKFLSDYLNETPDEFPNFKRLLREGASTLNARTDFTHTNTLPNHTCMITARPVTTVPGDPAINGHEWTDNSDPVPGKDLHSVSPDGYTASVFDVVHDHGLSTALYSGKSKFSLYATSYGAQRSRPDEIGQDNGRTKIDSAIITSGVHPKAMTDLKAKHPTYTFLHYPEPDAAGHKDGYLGVNYRAAVKKVDGFLGDLLTLLDTDKEWTGRTVIILSADHGGEPGTKGHGNAAHPFNHTIPFIVWGAGVTQGADLYKLNTTSRTDPKSGRPDYTAAGQPIRNGDGGNLALKLLGLPPIPGSTINVAQDLAADGVEVSSPPAAAPVGAK